MKKIKSVLTALFAVIVFTACEKEESKISQTSESPILEEVKFKVENSKSMGLVEMIRYTDHVIFFDRSDNEIYFLQINPTAPEIEAPLSSATNAYLSEDKLRLIVEQPSGEIEYSFIDNEVFGIGHIDYQSGLDDGILVSVDSRLFLPPNNDDYIPFVKCKCFNSNNRFPNNCTSGGGGATSCSVTSGNSGCSVSCQYSTPCCTADSGFTYS